MFYHQVFGLRCASDVELPAFLVCDSSRVDFTVKITSQVLEFNLLPTVVKPFTSYNDREFRYQVPDIATYFVRDGKQIWICPLCEDWSSVLLFFYSNAIAALLFQRNLIPFHVSGVLDEDGVWLLSAPSRTGKSTTALKLKERGYPVFTDDTALDLVQFEKLQEQEATKGFQEKPFPGMKFFSKGQSGRWRQELSISQIQRIMRCSEKMMKYFGYWDEAKHFLIENNSWTGPS